MDYASGQKDNRGMPLSEGEFEVLHVRCCALTVKTHEYQDKDCIHSPEYTSDDGLGIADSEKSRKGDGRWL
jgi:hypothetical protein